jgi:hypothetical protein
MNKFHAPEKYRITVGPLKSSSSDGNNGAFKICKDGYDLNVICSDEIWEHVSVSKKNRCPTWEEMCFVKDLFWGPECCVIQYHPPKSVYVSNHPFCLHLWRKVGSEFETPPTWMVGVL